MKLNKINKVDDSKYLKKYKLLYTNKAGKEKIYEMVSRNNIINNNDIGSICNGVCIIVRHSEEEKLLLIKEFRMAVNKYVYNIPAGIIEVGETVEETIKRELYEETGLTHIKIIKTLKPSFSAVGISDEKIITAFVEAKGNFHDNTSDNEDITPMFLSKDEVKLLLETEELAGRTQLLCEFWVNGF